MTDAFKKAGPQPRGRPPTAPAAAPAQAWVLYLIECAGERLYAGITNDLAARFQAHRDGRGARFTRAFPPVRIVAASTLPSRSAALKAEYLLKQQARSMKLRFLAGCGTPLPVDELGAPPRAGVADSVATPQLAKTRSSSHAGKPR